MTRSERVAKRIEDELDDHQPRTDPLEGVPPEPGETEGEAFARLQNQAGIDDVTLASLFGVEPPAMEHWRRHGVPAAHLERLRRFREVVQRVSSHGRERPVGEALVTPLPSLADTTLLDVVVDDDVDLARAIRIALQEDRITRGAQTETMTTRTIRNAQPRTVEELMSREPVTVDARDSLLEAALRMREADIGDVFVVDAGALTGVLTDRDIVLRGVAQERDMGLTQAGSVCSREVVTVEPDTSVDDARRAMAVHAVRRLPVVRDGVLVGALGIADIAISVEDGTTLAAIAAAPPTD